MRSFLAALRTLVLPYGATSGKRLILDGVNGEIDAFNSTGTQSSSMDGDGFHVVGGTVEMDLVVDSGAPVITFTDPTQGELWEGRSTIYGYTGSTDAYGVAIRSANNVAAGTSEHSVAVFAPDSLTLQHTDDTGSVLSGSAIMLGKTKIEVATRIVVESEVWQNVTLQNGWSNRANLTPLQYRMLPDGTVHLQGTISGGTSANGTRIGTVAAGYRPPTHETVVNISTDNGPAAYSSANGSPRLLVLTNGEIYIYGTGAGPLWFDTRWTSVA